MVEVLKAARYAIEVAKDQKMLGLTEGSKSHVQLCCAPPVSSPGQDADAGVAICRANVVHQLDGRYSVSNLDQVAPTAQQETNESAVCSFCTSEAASFSNSDQGLVMST